MIKNKSLRLYETLAHEAAMDAAERRELTPELRAISQRLHGIAHAQIDAFERVEKRERQQRRVRPAIRAQARPSMLARLAEIFVGHPRVVFAYRDFERMSDDDLRTALEDAEQLIERTV